MFFVRKPRVLGRVFLIASDQKRLGRAYIFWIASLMFGLPLLSSFYLVQYTSNSALTVLIPYAIACGIIGLVILAKGSLKSDLQPDAYPNQHPTIDGSEKQSSYMFGYLALLFATLALISYFLMKHFVGLDYPSPNSISAAISGIVYLVSISAAALTGLPFLLTKLFPSLRRALAFRKNFSKIVIVIGATYFVIYLLLVNQIVITGFNTTPGNYVSSPGDIYPFVYVFTSGPPPTALLESTVYVPQILIQLNQSFNLVIMPFEIVFAIILSALVASSIAVTYFIIRDSSKHSCLTGASLSGLGGFFGFTATCPTCLAPTLVSIFFGGVSATVPSIYSHVSGIILPPLISISALAIGIIVLDYQAKRDGHTFSSLATALRNHGGYSPIRGNSEINERPELSETRD